RACPDTDLLLFSPLRRWFRRRFVRGYSVGRASRPQYRDLIDLHRILRTVVCIAWHARDFLHQFNARIVALTENRVAAIEAWIGNLGDEKLRAIRTRSSVRIGKPPRTIESKVR